LVTIFGTRDKTANSEFLNFKSEGYYPYKFRLRKVKPLVLFKKNRCRTNLMHFLLPNVPPSFEERNRRPNGPRSNVPPVLNKKNRRLNGPRSNVPPTFEEKKSATKRPAGHGFNIKISFGVETFRKSPHMFSSDSRKISKKRKRFFTGRSRIRPESGPPRLRIQNSGPYY
jgi:hypothetical protein